jgi:hypothetical protein
MLLREWRRPTRGMAWVSAASDRGDVPEVVSAAFVSDNYFQVFGVDLHIHRSSARGISGQRLRGPLRPCLQPRVACALAAGGPGSGQRLAAERVAHPPAG